MGSVTSIKGKLSLQNRFYTAQNQLYYSIDRPSTKKTIFSENNHYNVILMLFYSLLTIKNACNDKKIKNIQQIRGNCSPLGKLTLRRLP
jgi:hypothetical protein